MAASNRETSIKATLEYEGGYTNHPSDPGGPTNWGITIADARRYWKAGATAQDVRDMPLGVVVEIYRQRYWATQRCDDLPAGVDFATFDYGVNSGIGRSAKVLQQVVGAPVDGKVGGITVAAARQKNAVTTVKAMCAERTAFLKRLKIWPTFGKGWTRRVVSVEARGVKMALEADKLFNTPKDVTRKLEAESKAAGTQAKKEAAKAGGTVAAPGAGSQTIDLSAIPHWALWLLGTAMAVALVWFTYRYWINRQRAEAYAAVAKES